MKKRKLKKWVKVVLIISTLLIIEHKVSYLSEKGTVTYKYTIEYKTPHYEPKNEVTTQNYRLTSYHTGDSTNSGTYVGAGLSTKSFQVNDKGWYTYKGKLVLATATNECLKAKKGACSKWNTKIEGKKYFSYYDEVKVIIDDIEYTGIVLDSCGACMTNNKIDLFVSNKQSIIDRGYKGINEIKITFGTNY